MFGLISRIDSAQRSSNNRHSVAPTPYNNKVPLSIHEKPISAAKAPFDESRFLSLSLLLVKVS